MLGATVFVIVAVAGVVGCGGPTPIHPCVVAAPAPPSTPDDWSAVEPRLETREHRLCGSVSFKLEADKRELPQQDESLTAQKAAIRAMRCYGCRYDGARKCGTENRVAQLRREIPALEGALSACRAEAARRRTARLAALPSQSLDDLRVIPAEYLLPEEAKRLADLGQQEVSTRASRREDGAFMQPVLTAARCWYQRTREATLKEITTEQHYSAVGGIVNTSKLYDLQLSLRGADAATAAEEAEAARLHVSFLGCDDAMVKTLMKCLDVAERVNLGAGMAPQARTMNPERDEACDDPRVRQYVEAAPPLGW